jgi:L-seryl-tRNA(Ser) seleniumtransferase
VAHAEPGESSIGGGSLPGQLLPTVVIALPVQSAAKVARRLRALPTPVVPRVKANRVLLDMRSVLPEQDGELLQGLLAVALAEASESRATRSVGSNRYLGKGERT